MDYRFTDKLSVLGGEWRLRVNKIPACECAKHSGGFLERSFMKNVQL